MDSAEFDVIMHGEDDGVSEMTKEAAASLDDYNRKLTDMAKQEAANERMKELRKDFESLTAEQKEALIAADKERQALEDLAKAGEKASESAKEQTSANKEVSFSMTDVNAAMQIGQQVIQKVEQAYAATVGESQKYAAEIRDLVSLTGQSAGQTARMVQTLDDYEVSVGDVEAAIKKMTANGLTPTIDTIAQLSEKYKTLNTSEERNQFLIDNLGKAGLEWTHVMEAGNVALRDKAAAIDANLIPSARELENAERLRIAQDDLADATSAMALSLGTIATPAVADFSDAMAKGLTGWGQFTEYLRISSDLGQRQAQILREQGLGMAYTTDVTMQADVATGKLTLATQAQIDAAYEQAKAEHGAAAAIDDGAEAGQKAIKIKIEQTAADKAAKEAAAALSQVYSTELSLATSLQNQQNNYTRSSAALNKQLSDLVDSYNDLDAKGYQPTSKEMVDIQKKMDDVAEKTKELAKTNSEAMAKFAYDNLVAKLSIGGLTDAEFDMAQKAGVSLGIFTQATADQAIALNNLTSQLRDGQITQAEFDKAVSDGTFTVKNANDSNTKSYFDYVQAAKEKLGDISGKTTETGDKTTEAASVTKSATEDMSTSWSNAASATRENIGDMKGQISDYIDAINSVPDTKSTTFTASFSIAGPGAQAAPLTAQKQGAAAGTVINYYIQSAYIGADHELSRTIV